jgi:predicted RNA-binding Zn ribbon-like protein
MNFSHYTDQTASLAADLANLYQDTAEDGGPTAAQVEGLLARYEIEAALDPAHVARLGELAAILRVVFAAPDAHTGTGILNDLLARTRAMPWISEHDGDPHLHFGPQEADVVDRVAATTAMSLAVVLCDNGVERLGQCAAVDCEDVFIDTSRSAQRRFCSQGCANRTNVREHRARVREAVDEARDQALAATGDARAQTLAAAEEAREAINRAFGR